MFDFLTQKFSSIFTGLLNQKTITADNINETLGKVREALLEADVPYEIVQEFGKQVQADIIGKKLEKSLKPGEQLAKLVHDRLQTFMGGVVTPISFQIPSVIMLVGLQGSGKTTTAAKLAHYINQIAQKRGKSRKILLGSVDFYRPAAIDQLEILAQQIGVDFYRTSQTEPVLAAQEIYQKYKTNGYEHLILDTAGRLHIDNQMLLEITKIDQALSPKYKILVLDAMTGQESLKIA
ncbi:MAG TPA: signal recognition particle receptor subunit alpha, partial [Candidatus Babeliales bacterium]|nr:signal recognition particle receptor subunit alpha [Candidatus Babeliales bacterium]